MKSIRICSSLLPPSGDQLVHNSILGPLALANVCLAPPYARTPCGCEYLRTRKGSLCALVELTAEQRQYTGQQSQELGQVRQAAWGQEGQLRGLVEGLWEVALSSGLSGKHAGDGIPQEGRASLV